MIGEGRPKIKMVLIISLYIRIRRLSSKKNSVFSENGLLTYIQ